MIGKNVQGGFAAVLAREGTLGRGDIGIGQLRGRRGSARGRERERGGREGGGESLAVPCTRRRVYAYVNATMRSPRHTHARACARIRIRVRVRVTHTLVGSRASPVETRVRISSSRGEIGTYAFGMNA